MGKDVGDYSTPKLIVLPCGDDTNATVQVYAPDGSLVSSPEASASGVDTATGGQVWIAEPYRHTVPLVWRETWTITGTGAGVQHRRIYVSATPGTSGPVWSPPPWKPADYVPTRTLVPVDTGANLPVNSFDDTTTPNGTQVERLTTDACAWVLAGCGTIAQTLSDMASAVAAIWVAASIQRGFPEKDTDVQRAAALLEQAQRMRDDLAKANEAATGTDPVDPGAALLPRWSFPAPDPRDRWI